MFDSDPYYTERYDFSQMVATHLLWSLLSIIPYIFYLVQLQRTLKCISPDLQKIKPDQVWLLLIPGFRLVWSFIVVTRIGDSLRAEQQRRGILEFDERPGFAVGMAMSCLNVLFRILVWTDYKVIIGLFALALLACWIVYWIKMAGFAKQLTQSGFWQQYASGSNPYYQQAWPQPQWQPQPPQQPDWQRQGMGQQWNQANYPPAQPPAPQQWNQQPAFPPPPPQNNQPPVPPPMPPAQNPWQPPQQNTTPQPPSTPPTDPNDYSRWMPPGSN
ncbi:MAG: hypothetical protein ACRC3B_11975 [Bacteroidia bacterium]